MGVVCPVIRHAVVSEAPNRGAQRGAPIGLDERGLSDSANASESNREKTDKGEVLWAVNSAVRFAGAPQSEHHSKLPTTQRSYAEGAVT